jgi:hypothetical protein
VAASVLTREVATSGWRATSNRSGKWWLARRSVRLVTKNSRSPHAKKNALAALTGRPSNVLT